MAPQASSQGGYFFVLCPNAPRDVLELAAKAATNKYTLSSHDFRVWTDAIDQGDICYFYFLPLNLLLSVSAWAAPEVMKSILFFDAIPTNN